MLGKWTRHIEARRARRHGILVEDDFLGHETCDLLVAAFERWRRLTFLTPARDRFFDHRYLWFTTLPEAEVDARRAMQTSRRRIVAAMKRFYGEAELYSDSIQLVVWPEGIAMPPHADSAHPDGAPHPTPWRDYASVVYLNDGYEGGAIQFPNLGLRFVPRKGTMLAFKGGLLHVHGVEEIRRGSRYTMPAWYTRDIRHRDATEEIEV